MIDIKLLRDDPDLVRASQRARGEDEGVVDAILTADERRRGSLTAYERLRAEQKSIGKDVARAQGDERQALLARTKDLAAEVRSLQAAADEAQTELDTLLRTIGNVVEPEEYKLFPGFFAKPDFRKRIAWSYIDARDLGQIVRLAIEKDGLGFQIFNAVNDHTSSDLPTAELLKRYYPGVPVRGELGEFEGLMSNRKAREMLGFREAHNWRREVPQG